MTQAEVTSRACDDGIAAGRDCRTGDERKKRAPESYIRRTTPQERRRVAEEMRGIHRETMTVEHLVRHDELLRFADLIDPTCHAEVATEDTSDGLTARHVKCSACHTVWLEPSRVRYCPNCGARRIFDVSGVANSTEGDA